MHFSWDLDFFWYLDSVIWFCNFWYVATLVGSIRNGLAFLSKNSGFQEQIDEKQTRSLEVLQAVKLKQLFNLPSFSLPPPPERINKGFRFEVYLQVSDQFIAE